MGRMQGKVAFITGGSDGIGRATAIRLAEEGAHVIICARRKENLAEAEAAVKAVGSVEAFQLDVGDTDAYAKAIDPMGLAYLHLILLKTPQVHGLEVVKAHFTGNLILNDSITLEHGNRIVDEGEAAAVSFARYFLSNPDLVRRFREGHELAHFNRKTLYTPGPVGYTDYPFINE